MNLLIDLEGQFLSPVSDNFVKSNEKELIDYFDAKVKELALIQAAPIQPEIYPRSKTVGTMMLTFNMHIHYSNKQILERILWALYRQLKGIIAIGKAYIPSRFRYIQRLPIDSTTAYRLINVHELERFSVIASSYPVTIIMRTIHVENQYDHRDYDKVFTVINSDWTLFSEELLPCPDNCFSIEASVDCNLQIAGIYRDRSTAPDATYFSTTRHYTSYGFRPSFD